MNRVLLVVMVDALRFDFIRSDTMPWVHGLRKRGAVSSVVEETFGFIGVRGAVFYGLYPKDTGYVFLYNLVERSGDFAYLRYVPSFLLDASRRLKRKTGRLHNRIKAKFDDEYLGAWNLARMPARVIKRLDIAEKVVPWSKRYLPGRQSIFDHVDSYLYLGYPATHGTNELIMADFAKGFSNQRFVWTHFGQVDWDEHEYGPESAQVTAALNDIDGCIRSLYEKASAEADVDLVVFGDHGCLAIEEYEDVLGLLPRPLLQDCERFVDSTMARFWCGRAETADAIREILEKRSDLGVVVDRQTLEQKYQCRYERKIFGDVLFVIHAGKIILPNFFQAERDGIRGMHGYLPEVEQNCAAVLVHSEKNVSLPERMQMPEMHGVLMTLLDDDRGSTSSAPAGDSRS